MIFVNFEHFSCPTVVLPFKLWKDKCWLEVRCELFVKNNTALLICTHICSSFINSKIVLWSRHTNFNLKSIEIFNNLILKMLIKQYWLLWEICRVSFLKRCCFSCMTSLAVTSSTIKTSMKFWGTAFKFWLRPWSYIVKSNASQSSNISFSCD